VSEEQERQNRDKEEGNDSEYVRADGGRVGHDWRMGALEGLRVWELCASNYVSCKNASNTLRHRE
jgi:hypothetical protein